MSTEATLLLEVNGIPEWVRLLPLGRVELVDGREPFEVDQESLAAIVAAFENRGIDLVIDYEHQTLQGKRAPAAGWIKVLEAREDGLWGRVEWTAQAKEYLQEREYRYFSPVLRLDPDTRKPTVLLQVALTNVPAIKGLPPLVAKWNGEPNSLDVAVQGPEWLLNRNGGVLDSRLSLQTQEPNSQNPEPGRDVSPVLPADLGGLMTASEAQRERSFRYGIGIKEGGGVLKPVELSEVPDDKWGDPVNYRFPCHNQEAAWAAWEQWNGFRQQEQYSTEEITKITERLKGLLHNQRKEDSQEVTPFTPVGEESLMKGGLKARLGLEEEATEEAFWQRLSEFWRELAYTLNLPAGADVCQVKGAVEALRASSERVVRLEEELVRLKDDMLEEKANRAVDEAMKQGKISPAQKSWAMEYYRRDPEGFLNFVTQVAPVVPMGVKLTPLGADGEESGLAPLEMEICRQLNLLPCQYREAKVRLSVSS